MRVLLLLTILLPACLHAAAGDLAPCVAIENDADRLACYDTAAGRDAPPAPPAASAQAATVPPARRAPVAVPAAPPAPSDPKPAAAAPVPAQQPAPAAAPAPVPQQQQPVAANEGNEQDFGLGNVGRKRGESIRSRHVGEFTGWSGRTLFKLENGQVWRQAESGRFRASIDEPYIIIERGAFNSYRLRVEGMNRSLRVKRVR